MNVAVLNKKNLLPHAPSQAVLLVNLGTPASTEVRALRLYLREFLFDKRVINLPAVPRWLLVNGIIAPFRPFKIKHNYEKIWLKEGSPLKVYTEQLTQALAEKLPNCRVDYAMRYGKPALGEKLKSLVESGIDEILLVPLYPQYASATIGSVLEEAHHAVNRLWHIPALKSIRPFFAHPLFIKSAAAQARPFMDSDYDAFLFSYHSLPKKHLTIGETGQQHCQMADSGCCSTITAENRFCYRAQCLATTRALQKELNLPAEKVLTSFQSRLGYSEWIRPYSTDVIQSLPSKGMKKVLAFSPSFITDCIETLEEIGQTEKHKFMAQGGEKFDLVPCVNASELWVANLAALVQTELSPLPWGAVRSLPC